MGGCGSTGKNLPRDPKDAETIDSADPRQYNSTTTRGSSGGAITTDAIRIPGDPKGTAGFAKRPGSGSSNGSKRSMKETRTIADDRPEEIEQKPLSARSQANAAVWSKLRNAAKTIHGYQFLAVLPNHGKAELFCTSLSDGVDEGHAPTRLQDLTEISEKQVKY